MRPYSTARVVCTYKCNRSCPGCINTLHTEMKVPPIGLADLGRYDEIILTGGEPLMFPTKLIELADHLKDSRLILYTNAPSYPQLFAASQFFKGITISLHDSEDAHRFNRHFKRFWGTPDVWDTVPLFFIRVYASVKTKVELFESAQYKMCEWKHPEDCVLHPNEDLYRLREPWV